MPVVTKLVPVAAPMLGVTSVGLVANTAEPEPVSSVKAPARLAEVKDPKDVVLPTEVTTPVRLALVVTVEANVAFPAVNPIAVPVILVPTNDAGVPSPMALPEASK